MKFWLDFIRPATQCTRIVALITVRANTGNRAPDLKVQFLNTDFLKVYYRMNFIKCKKIYKKSILVL